MPRMTIHETMMKLYNIEIYYKTIPCNGKSMGKAMGKSMGKSMDKVYECNKDEIGEMGNVSSMFHIFGSMFLMCRLLI
jgi:hypothetical protein